MGVCWCSLALCSHIVPVLMILFGGEVYCGAGVCWGFVCVASAVCACRSVSVCCESHASYCWMHMSVRGM